MSNIRLQISETVKESVYVKWFKNNKGLILASIFISIFLCILTYPGIFYSDSYVRVSMSSELKMALHSFKCGNSNLTRMNTWITLIPTFFILLSKELVGNPALYTFVQCFLMVLVSYSFGMRLSEGKHKAWNIVCITLTPVIWAYGVFYEASTGCIIAIMTMMLIIWKYDDMKKLGDRILSIIILLHVSVICFGYRANAFTVLPAFLIIILLKCGKKILRGCILIATICFGLALTVIIPKALNINTMSSFSASFVWEIISTIQTMDEDKRAGYANYLDDIFGVDSTRAAINDSIFAEQGANINPLFSDIGPDAISEPGTPKKILKKYFQLIKNEPVDFAKTKWEFLSHSFGIGKPLNFWGYEYNYSNGMGQFGFNDSNQRKAYVNFILAYMGWMTVFRMPWFMFLMAFVLLGVKRFLYKDGMGQIALTEATFLVAFFYYVAYLLNTQSFEFRYFFPSWLLLFLMIISSSGDIIWRYKKGRKILIMVGCVLLITCILGAYAMYTKEGKGKLLEVESKGTELYSDEQNRVFYLDGKLYFVAGANADTEYTYFLHFYPNEGEIINSDFIFKDKEIPSSAWTADIAVIDMPKQSISSIEFGQCYNKTKFWKASVSVDEFMRCPNRIRISDYSDANWTNGYSNNENWILLADTSLNNYLLEGKGLQLADDEIVYVMEVKEIDGHLGIYTDRRIENESIRNIQVVD